MIEHEQKYRISKLSRVQARALAIGFKEVSMIHQKDTYYSRADVDFMQTKECLRVREEHNSAEITYKPPTTTEMIDMQSIWKKETNLAIAQGDISTAHEMLISLGCKRLCIVNKYREKYEKKDIILALDTITRLGSFAEIEIMSELHDETAIHKIQAIAKTLGLPQSDIVRLPYRDLLMLQMK